MVELCTRSRVKSPSCDNSRDLLCNVSRRVSLLSLGNWPPAGGGRSFSVCTPGLCDLFHFIIQINSSQ